MLLAISSDLFFGMLLTSLLGCSTLLKSPLLMRALH